jgi:PAS domain S-box-containing protein
MAWLAHLLFSSSQQESIGQAPDQTPFSLQRDTSYSSELLQQLQLLHMALDQCAVAMIALDQASQVVLFNSAAESLFDLREEDLLGKPLPGMLTGLIPTLLDEHETASCKFAWGQDGNGQAFDISTKVWRNRHGIVLGRLHIIRDITAQEHRRNDLMSSERLAVIGQMAAGTVHELRNPLAAARGFVQMLGKIKSVDEHPHEYSELALLEIDRMDQILQEYLLLSKAVLPELRPIDLAALLQETLEFLAGVFAQKEIQVTTSIWQPVIVLGENQYVLRVLQHLLWNAMEATPNGGQISVNLQTSPNMATVTIRDNGHGMDKDQLEHCFDPFYSTKEAGIGLGLTVCQRLVMEMQGALTISSKLGEGAEVHLSFQLANKPN